MPAVDPVATVGLLTIIHNEYRTALLNRKYYGARLERYRTINRWFEIAIALGATTGTGIAGLAIWKQGYGTAAWDADLGTRGMLRFWCHLTFFRCFNGGSLALVSPTHT
jgi:hypothetical protein